MLEGGGLVSARTRRQARSVWFCLFTAIHGDHVQDLIKEILFWGKIYHDEDTIVHIVFPPKLTFDKWRRHFKLESFPALVLASDTIDPTNYLVFSSGFFAQGVFERPDDLRKVLDFYHNRLVDGADFAELRRSQTLDDLSKLTKIGVDKLVSMVSLS